MTARTIIMTGAGSGIGRAAALLAARGGDAVVVADVNEDGGEQTVAAIRDNGGTASFIRTDIAQEADVQAMVQHALSRYGQLDGAFNNAAIPQCAKPVHEITLAEWQRNIDINLTGTFLCMKYEIAAMLETGGGAIVNTSSGAGLVGFRMGGEYTASKHGVVGLTRSAALDYAALGIRINAIAPGGVRTPTVTACFAADPTLEAHATAMHPIGRLAEPEELADAAIWLLSDRSSYVTGACLAVDGGYTTF